MRGVHDWLDGVDRLTVVPWVDGVVEEVGYHPRTAYVETYWLPILGPSAVWLLRRVAPLVYDGPVVVVVEDLAAELGIPGRSGRGGPSPIVRTLGRLCQFQVARRSGADLAVRRALPPLRPHQLGRLPASLVAAHSRLLAEVAA